MRNDFCSNYLEHSFKGSTWSKRAHKYIKKAWKNGKWIYYYPITGKGYLKDAQSYAKQANDSYQIAKTAEKRGNNKAAKIEKEHAGKMVSKKLFAEHNYRNKSLSGIINKGKAKINSMLSKLKSTTKVTITHDIKPTKKKVWR